MNKANVKQLIQDYRNSEETEDYDNFLEKWGDFDEIIDMLITHLEGFYD